MLPIAGSAIGLVDLNGDDNLDILAAVPTSNGIFDGTVWVYAGNGRGDFAEPLLLPVSAPSPASGSSTYDGAVQIGDLNRDRKLDLISFDPGGWRVFLNTCQ
jgi:hypothetical protein